VCEALQSQKPTWQHNLQAKKKTRKNTNNSSGNKKPEVSVL